MEKMAEYDGRVGCVYSKAKRRYEMLLVLKYYS